MKLLIVAGPYEADRIRRAAVAAGAEAVAVEAGESLPAWIAASRPDLIVLAARAVHDDAAVALARVRGVPGGDVPVLFLCDESDAGALAGLTDGTFVRPVVPEQVVRRAAELVGAPLPAGMDFAAAGSSARRRAGSGPGPGRVLPTELPADFPILRPLERDAMASSSATGTVVATPWLRRIAASIDDAFDADMEQTLAALGSDRGDVGESTRQVPRELVQVILAASARAPDQSFDAASPGSAERSGGRLADRWMEGDLGEQELPSLLGRALVEGLTGRLRVRRDAVEKSVFFEAGRPVLAVSNVAQDRMVQMLVRQGRLAGDQANRAMTVATESGRRMGAVLIDLGYMKSSELLPAVRQHYEELITSLFAWTAGTYRFEIGAVADPRRVRLLRHPAALVLEGLRRGYTIERLRSSIGGPDVVLRLESRASSSEVLLELAASDVAAQRMPALFDGVRAFHEVARLSALPEASVLQLAVVLRAFGLLCPLDDPRLVTSEPVAARDRAIDRERIASRHALVREGDYFQVLGIDRGCGDDDVRAAYDYLVREFSDETMGAELAHQHATELDEIRGVFDEALRVLGDEDLRRSYREHLPASGARGSGARDGSVPDQGRLSGGRT